MEEGENRKQMTESERCNFHGKVFFLQRRAETGNTYILFLWKDIIDQQVMLVEMTATTGIAASFDEDARTLHS